MIGHLQRNKVRRTLPLVHLVHSADSPRLVAELDRGGGRGGPAAADPAGSERFRRAGQARLRPGRSRAVGGTMAGYGNLEVRGLMCMAGLEGDLDAARREFAALRELRDRLRAVPRPGRDGRAFDGHERRFRGGDRGGGHDRARRLGVVGRESLHDRLAAARRGNDLAGACPAGAHRSEVRGEQDGALKVCVTQSPEKGKANKAIVELLAKSLSLRKSQIELIAGETSPQKRFLIRGVTPEELSRRIDAAVNG